MKITTLTALAVLMFSCATVAQETPPIPDLHLQHHDVTLLDLLNGLEGGEHILPIILSDNVPPTILLEKEIDSNSLRDLGGAFNKLAPTNPKEVRIIISSGGGEMDAGFAMAKMIERFPAQVTCILDVEAESMASAIFQSCDRRVMTTRAVMMIHRPRGSCSMCEEQVLRNAVEGLRVASIQLMEQTCRKSKMTSAELLEKTAGGKEFWMDPSEALKLGFTDDVVPKVEW